MKNRKRKQSKADRRLQTVVQEFTRRNISQYAAVILAVRPDLADQVDTIRNLYARRVHCTERHLPLVEALEDVVATLNAE